MSAKDLEERVIVIEASVEKDYDPDMFRLQVDFEGERDDRAACVDSYNTDFAKVKAALVDAGIPADEIRNSSFSVSVHYDWLYEKTDRGYEQYRRTERIVDGYEYKGECSVERKVDFGLLADIWNALQELDGDFTFDISYRLEKPDECEKQLLRAAVAEARDRAETLADAAGSKLGKVGAIHYRFNHASSNYADGAVCEPCVSYCEAAEPSAPEFNPETIGVYCNVTVAWSLE